MRDTKYEVAKLGIPYQIKIGFLSKLYRYEIINNMQARFLDNSSICNVMFVYL